MIENFGVISDEMHDDLATALREIAALGSVTSRSSSSTARTSPR